MFNNIFKKLEIGESFFDVGIEKSITNLNKITK